MSSGWHGGIGSVEKCHRIVNLLVGEQEPPMSMAGGLRVMCNGGGLRGCGPRRIVFHNLICAFTCFCSDSGFLTALRSVSKRPLSSLLVDLLHLGVGAYGGVLETTIPAVCYHSGSWSFSKCLVVLLTYTRISRGS